MKTLRGKPGGSLSCAFVLLWAATAFARQPIALPLAPAKAAAVDAAVLAEMQKEQVVGMAIGIIEKGQVEYLKGYGLADREKNVPVTADTMFRWASCTKSICAIAALQLAEKGRLDLEADVRKYVPEFPDKGATITPHLLLDHQSGIVHYNNGRIIATKATYQKPHPFADPVIALDKFKESPLLFSPGDKFSYSSFGYLLLSAVIERAGQEKFAQQIRDRISGPLGLTTLQPDFPWVRIDHRAAGYRLADGKVLVSSDTDQSWKWGGGGYISNVGDFAGFAQVLLAGKLVSKDMETKMWTPQPTKDGALTHWGLGFEVTMKGGALEKISHDGKQEKTRTRFVIYPSQQSALVVMTNSEWVNPGVFSTLVYRALAKK